MHRPKWDVDNDRKSLAGRRDDRRDRQSVETNKTRRHTNVPTDSVSVYSDRVHTDSENISVSTDVPRAQTHQQHIQQADTHVQRID